MEQQHDDALVLLLLLLADAHGGVSIDICLYSHNDDDLQTSSTILGEQAAE